MPDWVNGHPEPEHALAQAQPGADFIKLYVGDVQALQALDRQALHMFASSAQPGANGGFSIAEDASSSGYIQPFGQRSYYLGDASTGCLEPIERGVPTRTEGGLAALAAEGLDGFGFAARSVADQGVYSCIGNGVVIAGLVGAGEALRGNELGAATGRFTQAPGSRGRARRSGRWVSSTAGRTIVGRAGLEWVGTGWVRLG